MAYSEDLAERVRMVSMSLHSFDEKRMFGGLCFLDRGNMCVGLVGDKLMVRVGKDAYEACLKKPHVTPMDFTGKPMRGFIYVLPPGLKTSKALESWLRAGFDFTRTLPAKKKKDK